MYVVVPGVDNASLLVGSAIRQANQLIGTDLEFRFPDQS